MTPDHFDILAKAADYSDYTHMRSSKFASRRLAKSFVEMDRLLFMKEFYRYDHVILTKMEPLEASPKNDILIGWMQCPSIPDPYQSLGGSAVVSPCMYANADIQRALDYLQMTNIDCGLPDYHAAEWTQAEESQIRETLQQFIHSTDIKYKFPCGMGPRRRKLVHYIAIELGLHHWSEGRSKTEKTVIVEKR
jgi:hypothetical protein